ncbi:M14 family metallopeptidase [Pseudoalteromonas xiamenensis]|uniref:M14 metallopeptidase family protein n=1 Tax=Pseudoalteromonas xiamenensis TaxID=882626 RepID=UPI0027E51E85|nr:M14 family metallopeptidase [Pseudoalteromonas xiamenensis]WMN58749.1 M14 family metallopeptidase [Pseudoalteromonas xiamenensis]
MRKWLSLAAITLSSASMAAPLSYYFESAVKFDPTIPTPSSVLGYEVGDWHVRHDQLVDYLKLLAEKSDRLSITEIGRTYEQRPLLLLSFSAPARRKSLDNIRQQRLTAIANGEGLSELPAVAWMGYSVHGNESSGSNAALLVAYYLAAAEDARIERLLSDTIILLDPSLNPDGLNRFASWVNSTRSLTPSLDPKHREHNESWPSSRTNHYLFDLNRDWLPLQHPESRARMNAFHAWKPNLLTDFHEMGPNSTYFFQPGVPSRTNPITPKQNVKLTEEIATFHAAALDKRQQLYFTKESFDDFYYGKGSTYPDINGAVGILFEQASSRGHLQQTINGPLSFAATIKNQLTTTLSSFDALLANQQSLKAYQQTFYNSAIAEARKEDFAGYVIDLENDKSRGDAFMAILKQHQVHAYPLAQTTAVDGHEFDAASSVYVPLGQPQYRVIKALFSEQTRFENNTFYDVSGWTIAHAFDLPFKKLKRVRDAQVSATEWQTSSVPSFDLKSGSYAYAFSWQDSQAPALLNALLSRGIKARLALDGFSARSSGREKSFLAGAVVIPAGLQTRADWFSELNAVAQAFAIQISAIDSGLTQSGIDLGSRQFAVAKLPKVLLVGGQGISQYELGEVWHFLDTRLRIAPTIVTQEQFAKLTLSDYTHVILVDGQYRFDEQAKQNMGEWVSKGGVIWGHKRGAKLLIENNWLNATAISEAELRAQFETQNLRYVDQEALAAKQRIAGAIFNTHLDITHPLTFGMKDDTLPMFKDATWLLQPSTSPFVTVANYTASPLLAGYADPININTISQSAALLAHRKGRGTVIGMTDNPVFRGYWYGTSRLLANALFFGHTLSAQAK